MSNTQTQEDKTSKQIFEAAVMVIFANSGKKAIYPDPKMVLDCSEELAYIAKSMQAIREKGYGMNVEPNQFTG